MSGPAETPPPDPHGLLIVDKAHRLSSTSIVTVTKARLRVGGAPKRVKVGHAGTLDPLATGVLVILIGRATRLQEKVMGGAKRYVAEIDLSRRSSTDDLEGELIDVACEPPPRDQIEHTIADAFVGEIMQAPPAHSAIWVDGKRAYDLARKGTLDQLEQRPVRVDGIEVLAYDWPTLTIDVRCGKGTYIRSLARDIGAALGAGGMLTGLRRTEVAPFTLEHARTLDDVPDPLLQEHLLDPELFGLPRVRPQTPDD